MDIAILFPFLLLIGAMFLMSRSAKNRQRQAMQMRDSMDPGTGVRTIGGLYATVKEVREDTVLLEIQPGVHAVYAKNAIGAVLEPEEYERIINGEPEPEEADGDTPVVPDDASSLTEANESPRDAADRVELGKADPEDDADASHDTRAEGENGSTS